MERRLTAHPSNRVGGFYSAMADWKNRICGEGEENPEQLLANPGNWRIHPRAQQDALSGVLNDVGWVQRIIVNRQTGHVIDGHLRVSLALRSQAKTVPVVYVDLTPQEELLVLATLDPLSAMAVTDKSKLDELLKQVNSSSAGVTQMLTDLAQKNGLEYGLPPQDDAEPQIDRAEELRVKWGVECGQLWRIGEHRLLCGDSTVRADVERVMGGDECGTMTDPPYGVDFASDAASQDAASENDRITDLIIPNVPHPLIYTPGKRHLLRELQRWEESAVKLVAWHKKFSMTRSGLGGADVWEVVLVVGADSKISHLATNHIEVMTDREPGLLDGHPCPKPVALFQNLIECLLGNFVFDPFCGSGTTLVACQNLGRKGRGVEISPGYCAVILQRMQDAFGLVGARMK